jgi:hypothetical protein
VYNENEAQARHSGPIVQLRVGLLLDKRTTFIRAYRNVQYIMSMRARRSIQAPFVQLKSGALAA